MTDRFQGKYRKPTARLQGYDYGQNGAYFVTICTRQRFHYFGEIVGGIKNQVIPNNASGKSKYLAVETHNYASLQPTIIGIIAIEYWEKIPEHYLFIVLDEFQIMPNHIHGILFIQKITKSENKEYKNKFGPQSGNLSSVLRGYKSAVKTFATNNEIEFGWQSRFHDHIIRDDGELNRIRNYIRENPEKWLTDRNNENGLYM